MWNNRVAQVPIHVKRYFTGNCRLLIFKIKHRNQEAKTGSGTRKIPHNLLNIIYSLKRLHSLCVFGLVVCGGLCAQTPQTIQFDLIPNQILGVPPFAIEASSTSGLPVTFASTTATVCTNAGGLVMLLSAGSCTITASQAGNSTYSPASAVSNTFNIVQANPSNSFTAAAGSPFTVGSEPDAVAAGDFNGDGIPDLLSMNGGSGDATVLLGNNGGGYTTAPGSPFAVGDPTSVVLGDFNGDGITDFAVANFFSQNIAVFLGNGSGGFAAAPGSPFAVEGSPFAVAVGDFNGDGVQDLAVADYGNNSIDVFLGNGLGGFTQAQGSPFPVGSRPIALVVADFNSDDIEDVAVTDGLANSVSVLLGDGTGNFHAAVGGPWATGVGPTGLAVGDFNGDGIPDLAIANYSGDSVTILMGNGSGGFTGTADSLSAIATGARNVAVGDLNGDGIDDLVVISNGATVFLGNGSGGFTQAAETPLPLTNVVTVADVNGDGIEDLVSANGSGDTVSVMLGIATGTTAQTISFAPPSNVTWGVAPFSISATASSGLAVTLAALTTGCSLTGNVVTILNVGPCNIIANQPGNGTYAAAPAVTQSILIGLASQTITFGPLINIFLGAAPFNLTATASSGLPVSYTSNSLTVCTVSGATVTMVGLGPCSITASQPGDGTTKYQPATPVTQTFTVTSAQLQTIQFDKIPNQLLGVSPFAIAAKSSAGLPVTFAATPTAVCTNAGDLVMLWQAGSCSIAATQNGNNVYAAAAPETRTFTVSKARPANELAQAGPELSVRLYPNAMAKGDFNGDGIPDLVLVGQTAPNPTGTAMTLLLGNGSGGFSASTGSPIAIGGATAVAVAVGDFNADGFEDLAVADDNGSAVAVLLGDGSGGFTPAAGSPFAAGTNPNSIVAGDFNGDGMQDLATTNIGSDDVTLLLGNGSGGFTLAPHFQLAPNSNPAAAAVGDFNGDGMPDLAVVTGGNVVVLLGNGLGGFTQAAGGPFPVANGPYWTVVGDFNGDGKLDVAVANESSHDVTVLLGDGSGGFMQAAGSPSPGGALAAADFNGDGIPDLAVVDYYDYDIALVLGSGSGTFNTARFSPFLTGGGPDGVVAGDFNGDGIEDVAIANLYDGTVTVLLGELAGNTGQTITFAALHNVTYGAAPVKIAATATSGLAVVFQSTTPYVCIAGASTVTIVGGGKCSVTALQPGSAKYAPAPPATQSFTVNPAAQTIHFAPLGNLPENAPSPKLTATASSGLPLSFESNNSVCTVVSNESGTYIQLDSLGTCSITASQPGNLNYEPAAPVTQTFNVLLPQTITFAPLSGETVGTAVTLSATATSGLTVKFASNSTPVCTVSGVKVTLVKIGTCSITASQAGSVAYAAAAPVTQTLTVTGKAQTIAFAALSSRALGAAPFTISAKATSALPVTFSSNSTAVCAVSAAKITLLETGTCSITAAQAGSAVYAAATPVTETFSVLEAQTITFTAPGSQALGTGPIALKATVSSGLPATFTSNNTKVCTVSGANATLVAVGTCSITASQAGDSTWAEAASVTKTFTVKAQ